MRKLRLYLELYYDGDIGIVSNIVKVKPIRGKTLCFFEDGTHEAFDNKLITSIMPYMEDLSEDADS